MNHRRYAIKAGFGALILVLAWASPASAQVSVNVNIGAPPPVIVQSPPTMLLLPEPGFYVAVGVPYDIYFISGRYYYLHENNWFWAPGYGGPWVHVVHSSLPPGLQKFKVGQLHTFRDREYGLYRAQGRDFKGGKMVAAAGRGGGGPGNGRGRGRN